MALLTSQGDAPAMVLRRDLPIFVIAPTQTFIYDIVVMIGDEEFSGESLKDWRESMGKSRLWLADQCGVSVRTVEAWEQGRRVPGGAARRLLGQLLTRRSHDPT